MIDQLLNIYYSKEEWHKNKLSLDEARKYFETLLNKGNIIVFLNEEKVLGYVEFWCVNLHQLQKIKDNQSFYIGEEDTQHGNICYIHNIWVDESCRGNGVLKHLKFDIKDKIKHCDYFAGRRIMRDNLMRIKYKGGF